MGNIRVILYLSVVFAGFLLWERWMVWNQPPPLPSLERPPSDHAAVSPQQDSPAVSNDKKGDMPSAGAEDEHAKPAAIQQGMGDRPGGVVNNARLIHVETDLVRALIGARGGDILQLDLLQVPRSIDTPDEPFRLLDNKPGKQYIVQGGLLHDRISGLSAELDTLAPSHHNVYSSSRQRYQMLTGENYMRVPLLWSNGQGIEVEKAFIFRRGSYRVEVEYLIRNHAETAWVGRQYTQLRRHGDPPGGESQFLYTFTGAAFYDNKYEKIAFDDFTETRLKRSINNGWAAILQHYFISAIIPEREAINDYYTRYVTGDRGLPEYIIGVRSPPLKVAAGNEGKTSLGIFIGPKLQNELEQTAKGLELTADYGLFTVISQPLFWLLDKINSFVGNWGWSIIILTILIKLVFYKLSETSYRSMAKMRKFQPQILSLRNRYKGDRQRQSQEMMALYRKEKINPLGGCLPILVQIPVFIALYWVLLESVELRQSPFIFWIHDLSTRDPYFVLPLLMGITMFAQTRLNPTPPDPIQAKVMTYLPVIFTFFFAFFPSGLVLYWFVNNLLSLAQQLYITRRIERTS